MRETPRTRLSALVIDDEIVTRAILADALEELGMDVREAGDGADGLRLFQAELPDLVLLDVAMPGMDGFAVCRQMRAEPGGEHLPILMLTGLDDEQSVEEAFAAGATDFATKPCNVPLLRHRLRYVLRAKHTADQLRYSEASLTRAQAMARVGSFELDVESEHLVPSNQARQMLFACARGTPLNLESLLSRVVAGDRERVATTLRAALAERRSLGLDFDLTAADGARLSLHLELEMFAADRRGHPQAMGTLQDLSEQRASEQRIRELAFFDAVTGLPNRAYFMERLAETLASAKRYTRQFAVMFIDLDQFKRINDTLGHDAGDDLLRQVADRISHSLRRSDTVTRAAEEGNETVARLGGDEFVVLLGDIRRPEDAALVARRILAELEPPFQLGGTEMRVSSSIGIASFPNDGSDESTLLKCADLAMYRVKTDGRNGYRFYTPALNTRVVERLTLEGSLRRALERGEFELHYQPQVDCSKGIVLGAEALVRWRNPDAGLVLAGDFIPVAEENGLIVPLSAWVLNQALRDARRWRHEFGQALRVTVNVAASQLRNDKLVADVAAMLKLHEVEPAALELEVTENMLAGDHVQMAALLRDLNALGVRFALDDFGTGQLALAQLKSLPLSSFKLDPVFIRNLPDSDVDLAVVKSAIALAHNLHALVIAESVEREEQARCLKDLGCDAIQGYYLGPPMSFDDLMQWLQERRTVELARLAQRSARGA